VAEPAAGGFAIPVVLSWRWVEVATVEMDIVDALGAARALVGCAERVGAGAAAGGPVPEIPEDRHGLRRWIADFEGARVAFDRRYAEGLESAGARVAEFAVELAAVDGAALPAAGAPR
jgi:hypothetical protein